MRRTTTIRLVGLAVLTALFLSSYSVYTGAGQEYLPNFERFGTNPWATPLPPPTSCSPQEYNDGSWKHNPAANLSRKLVVPSDALDFAGFTRCASNREYDWHLGGAENPEHYWKWPLVTSWTWTPKRCAIREFDADTFLKDLVELGGWLLVGDSITEGHFFSLSCSLGPHVLATPDYANEPYWDRAWPQHLWLDPKSPMIPHLKLPQGFNFTATPLVTFRRVDFLLTATELEALNQQINTPPPGFTIFGGESYYADLGLEETMEIFTDPIKHYSTMIVSTAGHWTVGTFPGFSDGQAVGGGILRLLDFFGSAMARWAERMQILLDKDHASATGASINRRVLVRSYLPGHDACHTGSYTKPWTKDYGADYPHPQYNWPWIQDFNNVFDKTVKNYPDIHYMGIEKPARLRPEAHVTSDCLHILSGVGVLEGWTHYMHHYSTTELDRMGGRKKVVIPAESLVA